MNVTCSLGKQKESWEISTFTTYLKWSEVAQLCPTLWTPGRTVAYQAPLSMGFSRQEHWSGLPFPSPGDLPKPGIEPGPPILQAVTLPSEPPGKPSLFRSGKKKKKCYQVYYFRTDRMHPGCPYLSYEKWTSNQTDNRLNANIWPNIKNKSGRTGWQHVKKQPETMKKSRQRWAIRIHSNVWKEAYKGDPIMDQSNRTHHSGKLSTRIDAGVTTSNPTTFSKITMSGVLGT